MCWHKWSKWEEIKVTYHAIPLFGIPERTELKQRKKCKKCGIARFRRMT